jgi:hypothetical protein
LSVDTQPFIGNADKGRDCGRKRGKIFHEYPLSGREKHE